MVGKVLESSFQKYQTDRNFEFYKESYGHFGKEVSIYQNMEKSSIELEKQSTGFAVFLTKSTVRQSNQFDNKSS